MTQSSMSTPYARRLAEKFKESQAYLRANGFSRSTRKDTSNLYIL